ncbi:hypothetical protein [Streptomyces avicenniae]|uniref:hypothetical protein n=1 Tax=Streptomyces avicenniae TaxID=500153 RepID=UPI00069CAF5E|nr:hypothetical protein [Streptomyces avicenniae]
MSKLPQSRAARRFGLFLAAVLVLYAAVTYPARSAEFTALMFAAVADATEGVGELVTDPLP